MEKLERKDVRFIVLCIATIIAGILITAALYRRAFPEASIEFRANRGQARELAEKFLSERGRNVAGHRFAGRFEVEEEPKVYLERELGLEKASRYYGREAKVWRWQMRWFRSGVKEEERVEITPLGDLAAFSSVRKDDAPGASLSEADARALAHQFLASRGLDRGLKAIEATPTARPRRMDWRFVDELLAFQMGDATVRYATEISGNEVTGFEEFVHVPETWSRDYAKLRSKNITANSVGNLALFVTFLAMLVVLLQRIVRKDVRWRLVAGFGLVAFVLSLFAILNNLPLTLYGYDTASPLSAYVVKRVVLGILGAIGIGAGIAVVVAAAEPIYRERFGSQLSLSGLFSRRGARSKRFFLGLLLGYALTAFFFAYQAVFYVVAARFGAWAPAEIPYDDILNTAVPWVTVLFVGFLPSVLEEGTSRMFSISLLDKLGAGRFVAVVLPAFIWGFNHAGYPNQPFYIRGIEVGVAGCVIGALMLRFGVWPLLVWHFTVDALYTAFLLLRSGNAYLVVSGGTAALILLLPLGVSVALYLRRGGFQPESGLTNAEEGFVAPPPPAPGGPQIVAPVRAIPPAYLLAAGAVAVIAIASFLVPSKLSRPLVEDATGPLRAGEIARSFLQANGVAPERFETVTYAGTGFADDQEARDAQPGEFGKIPAFADEDASYVVQEGGLAAIERLTQEQLPLAFWVTRFFHPLEKGEWKVLVDARRRRVIGFVNPVEESAGADAPPADSRARERALEAAGKLGYPAASYKVLEVGRKARPKRTDTTVVLESSSAAAGESSARLTAVFHGSSLAAFYPTIRVPDSFLRDYRKQSVWEPLLLGLRIVGIGGVIGVAMVMFIRLVKSQGFGWRKWRRGIALVGALSLVALANSMRSVLRVYPTEQPFSLFLTTVGVGLTLFFLLILCGSAVAFVLIEGARPGWLPALRTQGSLGDAFLRAIVGAAGLWGLERWARLISERVPDLIEIHPALPPALETAVPALAVLWTSLRWVLLAGAVASAIALGARESFFRKGAGKALIVIWLVLVIAPSSFHSAPAFFGELVPDLLTAAWVAFVAFGILRNHVAAWVLFGVLVSAGPAISKLLAQPAPADRAAGWMSLALVIIALAGLLMGGRRQPAVTEPVPVEAPLLPEIEV
jgi:hypothetical protein